jgi:hypothetical protein
VALDSWAFLDELVCLPRPSGGRWKTALRAFCLSAPWQIYETLYLLLRVQECRFVTPAQGAGMQASNSSGCKNDIALHGGWDTHSSALGLQT